MGTDWPHPSTYICSYMHVSRYLSTPNFDFLCLHTPTFNRMDVCLYAQPSPTNSTKLRRWCSYVLLAGDRHRGGLLLPLLALLAPCIVVALVGWWWLVVLGVSVLPLGTATAWALRVMARIARGWWALLGGWVVHVLGGWWVLAVGAHTAGMVARGCILHGGLLLHVSRCIAHFHWWGGWPGPVLPRVEWRVGRAVGLGLRWLGRIGLLVLLVCPLTWRGTLVLLHWLAVVVARLGIGLGGWQHHLHVLRGRPWGGLGLGWGAILLLLVPGTPLAAGRALLPGHTVGVVVHLVGVVRCPLPLGLGCRILLSHHWGSIAPGRPAWGQQGRL
eukprot:comp24069_c1_seq1/m.43274 comp24069_c1_seq1/g.43274  ORF comp24069_c1_seq1/g.43274 comp24069_c1_seq1/m.43274 type:complete len:330 (+) comp24069_c1_seq1:397-1386(+)